MSLATKVRGSLGWAILAFGIATNGVADDFVRVVVRASKVTGGQDHNHAVEAHAEVFGRTILLRPFLIDSRSQGLATVFVTSKRSREFEHPPSAATVSHHMALANGQYYPRAIVAREGDELVYRNYEPVGDSLSTPFESDIATSPVKRIRLLGHADKPVVVSSSIYRWMRSWVFVEKSTVCRVTDQLGRCQIPLSQVEIENEGVILKLWHPEASKLVVERVSPRSKVVNDVSVFVPISSVGREVEVVVAVTGNH